MKVTAEMMRRVGTGGLIPWVDPETEPYQVDTIKPLTMVARTQITDETGTAVSLEIRTYGDAWVEIFIDGRFRYAGALTNETLRV
ncbi:MAG: hypothetical protein ACYS7Y_11955 [Planctomycetota bacterium]|jgi:hypothetical protein